jgi:glycerol-3-phosphate acyltransferase PlsX
MRIAVDAMGGDFAPAAVVQGGIEAAKIANGDFEIVLVGDKARIEQELHRHFRTHNLPLSIHHASEMIDMDEAPAAALKRKRDASISVANRLQKRGEVDAVISAGNTGAAMASALLELGRIHGVKRPGIGSLLPNGDGAAMLIDVGANVDCKPQHLLQFGLMGSIYMNRIIGIEKPRVGLLSIGEEPGKGNEATVAAHELLTQSRINFVGNIEGRDILKGAADVVVCDGFVGNVILKFAESIGGVFTVHMKRQIGKKIFSNLGAFLLKPTFRGLKKVFDYEEYGGAPLLGVDGVSIICHGGSTPKAIKNAVREAAKMIREGVNQTIRKELQSLNGAKIVQH